MFILLIILAATVILFFPLYIYWSKHKKKALAVSLPPGLRSLLAANVQFYTALTVAKRVEFEERMQYFLSVVRITGIGTEVEELDRVLIAAGAIIPIFGFPGWVYNNLHEVLVYPDAFNEHFEQKGPSRNILGVVGSGAYENIMILSKAELRSGFENESGKSNTVLHEFAHLVDKADGTVDGVPEDLLQAQYILPWIDLMHEKIKQLIEKDTDINPYAATNEAEFYSVVTEYFFKRPDLLKQKHPDLYEMLVKIYRQQPVRS